MAERSNIYNNTAQDVINLRRQLAALLAPPRPSSTPFLDYQLGQQLQNTQPPEDESGQNQEGQGNFWTDNFVAQAFRDQLAALKSLPQALSSAEGRHILGEQIWRSLPINPYFWTSPEEKNRMLWEDWRKENNLPPEPPVVGKPIMRGVGELPPAPIHQLGPTERRDTQSPGEKFIGEWAMPASIPGGLARTPVTIASKVIPRAVTQSALGRGTGKVLDVVVGSMNETRPPLVRYVENATGAGKTIAETAADAIKAQTTMTRYGPARAGFAKIGKEQPEINAQSIAAKLIKGEQLNPDELKFSTDNAQAIEDAHKLLETTSTVKKRKPWWPPLSTNPEKDIVDLYHQALKDTKSKNLVEYAEVTEAEALKIEGITGFDIRGLTHIVDAQGLRHIYNEHVINPKEILRGQVPLDDEDFARIPEIVKNPDTITRGKTKEGLDAIEYGKRFNGNTLYVEEIRRKNQQLAAKSLLKTKSKTRAVDATSSSGSPPAFTPEAVPGAINSISSNMNDFNETKLRQLQPYTEKWAVLTRAAGKETRKVKQVREAFRKVWFDREPLTPQETSLLQTIYQKYPLEAPDFDTWLKKTVFDLFEKHTQEIHPER